MQDCFRQHPDVYGSELEEDEVDEQLTEQIAQRDKQDQAAAAADAATAAASGDKQQQSESEQIYQNDPASATLNEAEKSAEAAEIKKVNEHTQKAAEQEENLVPKGWHASEEEGKTTEK